MKQQTEDRQRLLHILRLANKLLEAYGPVMPNASTAVDLHRSLVTAIGELEWDLAAVGRKTDKQIPQPGQ